MGQVVVHPASSLLAPELLHANHPIGAFNSRAPELNTWLVKTALHNAAQGFTRTFVVSTADQTQVVGYYSLSAGVVQRAAALKKMQRNAPDPIPVMVLSRLAVDQAWEGRGIGQGMLQQAILRSYKAGQIMGIAALLVHCLSEQVMPFYHNAGFKPSPLNPLTMMLAMAEIEKSLG